MMTKEHILFMWTIFSNKKNNNNNKINQNTILELDILKKEINFATELNHRTIILFNFFKYTAKKLIKN